MNAVLFVWFCATVLPGSIKEDEKVYSAWYESERSESIETDKATISTLAMKVLFPHNCLINNLFNEKRLIIIPRIS